MAKSLYTVEPGFQKQTSFYLIADGIFLTESFLQSLSVNLKIMTIVASPNWKNTWGRRLSVHLKWFKACFGILGVKF